jgi:cysteine-rich repeat protein
VGAQPLNCSDGKQCTFDECHTVTGCYNPKVPDFMQCNDFNLCTVGDHCRDGECVKTSDLPCDDGNDCTRNLCQPATGCDFSQPTVFCCGNGILETPYEECDDGNRVSGDGCEADCKLPPCPWWNYEQLFCNGDCSQAGGTNCDKADADLLCKLKTCRCNAVALSFQIKQVRSGPGFSCPGSGIYVGTQPLYCVNVPIWHTPQLMGVDFGTVVTDVVCSN